jgi:hypothetical protein
MVVSYTLVEMAETKPQRVHLRVAARDDELFRDAAAAARESLSDIDAAAMLIGVLNGERCDSSPIGYR